MGGKTEDDTSRAAVPAHTTVFAATLISPQNTEKMRQYRERESAIRSSGH